MTIQASSRLALILVLVVAFAAAGCGTKVARTVDVANGEYYTDEEFKNLSKEQRDAYCAAMDAELASVGSAASDAESQAGQVQSELSSVQSEIRTLESQYADAKSRVDGVQDEVDYFENLPRSHTVADGEFLQKIAGYETIYNDPLKWPRIWRANKAKLQEQGPNLIYPGWELAIPRDWPSTWTVRQDEYLSKISGYWEVYEDPTQWTRIYEANRDQISDPDLIWPDWELTIPRDGGASAR